MKYIVAFILIGLTATSHARPAPQPPLPAPAHTRPLPAVGGLHGADPLDETVEDFVIGTLKIGSPREQAAMVESIVHPTRAGLRELFATINRERDLVHVTSLRPMIDNYIYLVSLAYAAARAQSDAALDDAFDLMVVALVDAYLGSPSCGDALYDDALARRYAAMRVGMRAFRRPGELAARLRLSAQLGWIRQDVRKGVGGHQLTEDQLDALDRFLLTEPLVAMARAEAGANKRAVADALLGELLDRDSPTRERVIEPARAALPWASEPQRFGAIYVLLQADYALTVGAFVTATQSHLEADWLTVRDLVAEWRRTIDELRGAQRENDVHVAHLLALHEGLTLYAKALYATELEGQGDPIELRRLGLRQLEHLVGDDGWPATRLALVRGELTIPAVIASAMGNALRAPTWVERILEELFAFASTSDGPRWALFDRRPLPTVTGVRSPDARVTLAGVMAERGLVIDELVDEVSADVVNHARTTTSATTRAEARSVVGMLLRVELPEASAKTIETYARGLIEGPDAVELAGSELFVLQVCTTGESTLGTAADRSKPTLEGLPLDALHNEGRRVERRAGPLGGARACFAFLLPKTLLQAPTRPSVRHGSTLYALSWPSSVHASLRCELRPDTPTTSSGTASTASTHRCGSPTSGAARARRASSSAASATSSETSSKRSPSVTHARPSTA